MHYYWLPADGAEALQNLVLIFSVLQPSVPLGKLLLREGAIISDMRRRRQGEVESTKIGWRHFE